jgi:hypothetical protein
LNLKISETEAQLLAQSCRSQQRPFLGGGTEMLHRGPGVAL